LKINKVDHISIAVKDLESARRIWEPLLGKTTPDDRYVDDAEEIRVARYWIGEVGVELMESTTSNGPVAEWITKHGEGVMVLSFLVDNTKIALKELQQSDYAIIPDKGGKLTRPFREGEFALIHPRKLNGVLAEIIDENTSITE
jgi:methylmalonyl-CoA/ethylmalonyl-CoA epimerase